MKTTNTKLASFFIITSLITATAAQAKDVEAQPYQPEQVKIVNETASGELANMTQQLLQDLQLQLTGSIKQQANSALVNVVDTVKALLQ